MLYRDIDSIIEAKNLKIRELDKQVDTIRIENEKLKKELVKAAENVKTLGDDLKKARGACHRLREERDAYESEYKCIANEEDAAKTLVLLRNRIKEQDNMIFNKDKEIRRLALMYKEKSERLNHYVSAHGALNKVNDDLRRKNRELATKYGEACRMNANLDLSCQDYAMRIDERAKKIEEKELTIAKMSRDYDKLTGLYKEAKYQSEQRMLHITKLEERLKKEEFRCVSLRNSNDDLLTKCEKLERSLKEKAERIERLQNNNAELVNREVRIKGTLKERDDQIAGLMSAKAHVEEIHEKLIADFKRTNALLKDREMQMKGLMALKCDRRPCKVGDKKGTFIKWINIRNVIDVSCIRRERPNCMSWDGGMFVPPFEKDECDFLSTEYTRGLVEYDSGMVDEVEPKRIQFLIWDI